MFQDTWAVSDSQCECKFSNENRKVGAPFLHSVQRILRVLELADKTQCAGFGGSGRGQFVKGDSSVGLPCAEALQHWSNCALSDGSGWWSYWSSLVPLVIRDISDAESFSANNPLRCFLTTYWLGHFMSLACLQSIECSPESEQYL